MANLKTEKIQAKSWSEAAKQVWAKNRNPALTSDLCLVYAWYIVYTWYIWLYTWYIMHLSKTYLLGKI